MPLLRKNKDTFCPNFFIISFVFYPLHYICQIHLGYQHLQLLIIHDVNMQCQPFVVEKCMSYKIIKLYKEAKFKKEVKIFNYKGRNQIERNKIQ